MVPHPAALLWTQLATMDPGLLRLLLALRGTLSVGLSTVVVTIIAKMIGCPITELAFGVVFSMVAAFVIRDPTRRGGAITLGALLVSAAIAATVATLVSTHPPAGEMWFLLLVFLSPLFQLQHPRALGLGLIAMIMTYVGLYLRLPPEAVPVQLGSLLIGAASITIVCFVLLPLRPAMVLRWAVRSVRHRTIRVLREIDFSTGGGRSRTLRRHLVRLNASALAAEDQLILLAQPARDDVRLHLFELEQAVTRLIALVDAGAIQAHHRDRLRLARERLRRGRVARRASGADPVEETLLTVMHASMALEQAASGAVAVATPSVVVAPAGALAWRSAVRVTLAAMVAMVGGMMLSPERWFWAVITVYIVFLNTRTRGDTLYRASHRICGTLLGLFGGAGLSLLIAGNTAAACATMLAAVFGIYYFYTVSYGIAVFCVTVLLGMVYGVLGTSIEQVLLLRVEETTIGVLAAGLAASFLWPIRTRHQIRLSGQLVLRSLADVVRLSVAAMQNGPSLAPIEAARRLDRQIADLRLARLPLTAGRFIMRRGRADRPLTALIACADLVRDLARAASRPVQAADIPRLQTFSRRVEARIEALLSGMRPPEPLSEEAATPAGGALVKLDLALAMLAERLGADLVDGFEVD